MLTVHPATECRQRVWIDLLDLVLQSERVVFRYGAFSLNREDSFQIRACGAPEGGPLLGRCHFELGIEFRYVVVPTEPVGLFPRSDPGQAQFLR
jgi:hypothetical protein